MNFFSTSMTSKQRFGWVDMDEALDQSKNGVKEEDVVSDIAKLEELPKEEKA